MSGAQRRDLAVKIIYSESEVTARGNGSLVVFHITKHPELKLIEISMRADDRYD